MVQGVMAGWIIILIMLTLYVDENLRHAIPAVFGVFLAIVVIAIPIWFFTVLSNSHKREKTKRQVAEIEVVE